MRALYPIMITISVAFLLGSCTSPGRPTTQMASNFIHRQDVRKTTKDKYPPKNPTTVAMYTKDTSPHTAYRVIGVAKVSKYNLIGLQRQENTINDMMKDLAASIGGDGLIDMSENHENIEAKIIAFQKILI
jgi:hypothetical protein